MGAAMGSPVQEIRKGDVVRIPPGPEALAWRQGRHTHETYRIHEQLDGKVVEWWRRDEQYGRR
jgi:hypothetical protein